MLSVLMNFLYKNLQNLNNIIISLGLLLSLIILISIIISVAVIIIIIIISHLCIKVKMRETMKERVRFNCIAPGVI